MPWGTIAIVVVCIALFFSGAYFQHGVDRAHYEAQQKEQLEAANDQLIAQASKELAYENQLRAAARDALDRSARLARLRAAPRVGIVCERTDSRAVSSTAPAPAVQPPADGVLSQATGPDIGPALYDLADQADSAVETAREALAQWPE